MKAEGEKKVKMSEDNKEKELFFGKLKADSEKIITFNLNDQDQEAIEPEIVICHKCLKGRNQNERS